MRGGLLFFHSDFRPLTYCGLIALAGKPNAGKSTLLNRIVGEKLAITSEKPQSTRERVVGILTRADAQLVLTDTPGLFEPRSALQRSMRAAALRAIADADVLVYLVDASDGQFIDLAAAAGVQTRRGIPIITVFNKVDLVRDDAKQRLCVLAPDAMFISATTGEGVHALLERIIPMLPESPFLYDSSDISTQSMRQIAAEFIRESALRTLRDEVPHAVACTVEEFRESQIPVYIRAVLYVERPSQKRILIGHGGSRLKEIGSAARVSIEALTDAPVYLDLWVKVLHNWRRDVNALRRLGFAVPEDSPS